MTTETSSSSTEKPPEAPVNNFSGTPVQSPPGAPVSSRLPSPEEVERQHIVAALRETNWRIEGERGAAKLLNLQPSTLRSRMQKLGIARHAD